MSCAADKAGNLEKSVSRIREAAAKGAQIICLQFANGSRNRGISLAMLSLLYALQRRVLAL